MRPLSAGERAVPPSANLVDPYGLDPAPETAPPDPAGFGGAGPWYASLPGGVGPRFSEGVPKMRFRVTPFDHVVSARQAENPMIPYQAGRAWGNTGFGQGSEVGDLSETTKTSMTAVFFLGAVALAFYMYSGQRAR